jgi:hypothetical protein
MELLVTQNTRINESLTTLINESKRCSDEVKSLKEIIEAEVATSVKNADNEFIKVNILLYYIYR